MGKLEALYDFNKAETEAKRIEAREHVKRTEQQNRRDLLQYSGIGISLILLVIVLVTTPTWGSNSGKMFRLIRVAPEGFQKFLEGVNFLTFLLVFEFVLVLLDPYLEQYSGGEPAIKLIFNAAAAAAIFPIHSFFETKLRKRMLKNAKQII